MGEESLALGVAEKLYTESSQQSDSQGEGEEEEKPSGRHIQAFMNHCLHLERERWEATGLHTEQDEGSLPYCLPHLSISLVAARETEPSIWP